jgi:MSHA biogenesis protein MshJ
MKAWFAKTVARIDAFSVRERALIFLAVGALAGTLFNTLFIEPRFVAAKRMTVGIAQQRAEIAAVEKQILALVGGAVQDPDHGKRARLMQLQGEIGRIDTRIHEEEAKVTTPRQMRVFVEGLMTRNPAVALVELRSVPVAPVVLSQQSVEAAKAITPKTGAAAPLHRHGLEVTVAGNYLDLMAYARDLERLPNRIYWRDLSLDATAHPRVVMKLNLYTLSLDKAWMQI